MSSEKLHDALKNWIMEKAELKKDARKNKYYDRVFSGDMEPVDIRVRMKHFDYRPDIVLVRKDRKYLVEIALSEDWRALVGELSLAKACRAANVLFIVSGWDKDALDDILTVMGEVLDYEKWYYIILDDNDVNNLEKAKKVVSKWLTDWEWI
nr:MAG: hypothetical protein AM325_15700 [Candidatus Thorarchaeota archaeon SMTZ1-45]